MSFSADILDKKLGALQETQDSIVSISQWVLFHHRHSKETAGLWARYISSLPSSASAKKLSLLYLCNDVVQQARHKRKTQFISDFSGVLPDVLHKTYNTLEASIKPKVDRLINVWSDRNVFSQDEIKMMRRAIELSKNDKPLDNESEKATPDSVAVDLRNLNALYMHFNQVQDISQGNLNQVGLQSKTYLPEEPSESDNLPSPRVYISKLNILEKLCNITKNNVDESKKTRMDIIKQLDNLKSIMSEGLQTDDKKNLIIDKKLEKLNSTRNELHSFLEDDTAPVKHNQLDIGHQRRSEVAKQIVKPEKEEEEEEEDTNMVPTYENSDSESEEPPAKKSKRSESSDSNPVKKTVAFSDNVEVKEYDKDEDQADAIQIVKDEYDFENEDEDEEYDLGGPPGFISQAKDDLELKHEHDNSSSNGHNSNNGSQSGNPNSMNNNVLNLLAKLS